MAVKETIAKTDERVKVFIPLSYASDDPNLYVAVNGVGYLLPRGAESLGPRHIAREIERSRKAEAAYNKKIRDLQKKQQNPT